jgi:hypothetical protein
VPTAKGGYYLKNKERVPSVTTIISACKIGGIDPLLAWANREGLAGREFRDSRQKAADAGTCAHERVDAFIHKKVISASDIERYGPAWAMSEAPVQAFFEWKDQSNMEMVAGELPLVSEQYRYGGTLDAIALNNKLMLADWKTSNGCYPEYLIQVAAYGHLWNENNPDYPVEGYFIARFNKQEEASDQVSFHQHYWKNLDLAWEAFLHMRELYELNKKLRKMI